MAEMLESGRVPTKERQQKYYSSMVQESERLTHLIDNILDFSRIEAGQKKFQFAKGNLALLIEETVMSFKNQFDNNGFSIDLAVSEPIHDSWFDGEAIQQVLYNLIDNAIKYSGNSKIIEIKLSESDDHSIMEIKDYGIGIKKDDQDKIFDRFYRAGDEMTRKVKGSGIGLTIVKQIVDAHRGMIKLKSGPVEGTTFYLILPRKLK
jgi:two-component system phosphate regulon sensor histidine kinase PhoR